MYVLITRYQRNIEYSYNCKSTNEDDMSIRVLSTELQQIALNELNEVPQRIQEDITHIKDFLLKQPHINARQDDQMILMFLRGCKFSLERTKEKLDIYYTMKTLLPEIYGRRDPLDPDIQKLLSLGLILPLPILKSSDPRYSLIRNEIADQLMDLATFLKVGTMIQDILTLEDDNMVIAGSVVIQDVGQISMNYALSIPPTLLKKAITCVQSAYPQRLKGVYLFNMSSVFEKIYNLFKPLLPEKLKQTLHILSSFEEMCEHVPQEVLPEEYGGKGGKVDDIIAFWKTKVESYRDWFLEDAQYKSDESKRPANAVKFNESIFGVEGSFRQLSVD